MPYFKIGPTVSEIWSFKEHLVMDMTAPPVRQVPRWLGRGVRRPLAVVDLCGPKACKGPQPPTGRPAGDVGPANMSVAGSQHLLRSKIGVAHEIPTKLTHELPNPAEASNLCGSLLVAATGKFGAPRGF